MFHIIKSLSIFSLAILAGLTASYYYFAPDILHASETPVKNYSETLVCSPFQQVISFPNSEFCVDIMKTEEELSRGLMYVEKIPENYGMLFDFKNEQPVSMWMKNTPVALDMIFLDKRMCINFIHEGAVPFSEEIIMSPFPAQFVLEVAAGIVESRNLSPGACIKAE